MMRYRILLILLLFVVVPVSSMPTIPWCGHQDLFFWNASSDLAGYRAMPNYPELDSQRSITSPSVTAASGEKTLGTWITPLDEPNSTTLAPGVWRFHTYARASSESGITTLRMRTFNRSANGNITWLFYGNAFSTDISAGTVPTEYILSYARRNYTTFFAGDRLGIQINVSTSSSAGRTITLDLAGNTNASMVSAGYWVCSDNSTSSNSGDSGDGGDGAVGAIFGIIGGLIGGIIYSRRKKSFGGNGTNGDGS